ncbi:quinate utilization oxidoreductase protein [Pochonia chlamydosporia 170]|uniref:Quinate utilization oxidoreductase protein n=1 Tax=Pochonia chlamydosporia 170 TaxID=1380566 RepID=A0A179F244_METCM|nr:quinate utilization oxidoreductase protein [Pochonia chlamydosporia 170]OAQ59360.1 quinate utilization oxidoreductase protein [Pochonia chlamydosporia 170]
MASSESTPVHFVVIGAGIIGPRHAMTIVNNHEAKLVAIIDPSPAGQTLAVKLGVNYFTTVDKLLNSSERVDAAVICTPNHTHVSIAKQLASHNVHVIIEKPISSNVDSGRDLVSSLSSAASKVLVGHHRRFNPYIMKTKDVLATGKLGKIMAINGIWALHKPIDYFQSPAEWRQSETGGAILINMIHEIDLLHYLIGPIVRVHAEGIPAQRGYTADEGAAMTLKFKTGAVGTFLLSDYAPSPYNFESGSGENPLIPKAGQDFYRIFGTEGCLSVPDMALWSYSDGKKSWHSQMTKHQIPVDEAIPFDLQLQHFINAIRGREDIKSTPQSGLAALIVCDAIKEALDQEKTVYIADYSL